MTKPKIKTLKRISRRTMGRMKEKVIPSKKKELLEKIREKEHDAEVYQTLSEL